MNKKVLSTSLSLACHTIFLVLALNLVFQPPSISMPVAPPIYIHVHLEAKPYSPSMGVSGPKVPQKKVVTAPAVKAVHKSRPRPVQKKQVSHNTIVSVVKQHVTSHNVPKPKTEKEKSLFNTKEVFKDMKMADIQATHSTATPVTDITSQIQQLQSPSLETTMQNSQGESPYIPFDQNGSGTDIKTFLGYDLYTYEDPNDHLKYFRLSIHVEDIPGTLSPMPKEITFLVDASGSIGNQLLDEFKTGISNALDQLGESDYFNVLVFNSDTNKLKDQPVPNNLGNVRAAKDFMQDFRSVSETDLYDTVLKSVESTHVVKPSYILLFSDGQPTAGITDSLQFINKIGDIDNGHVPIFALGAGATNDYLLNFLTFTNHGWAEFADRNVEDSIKQVYYHIKDPVLTNLRFYSSGLNRNEMYPKLLPDLFKGSEFVLYGQYTNESNFLFQLRGDSQTDIKQYVIKDNLNNGREGDRRIAEEWAMRKIYHLIGQLQYNQDNQAIIDEINQLADKFQLKIPKYKA